MKIATFVAVPLAVLIAGSASAASLRNTIIVESDVVRLGDIFEDAGVHADRAVLNAPAPGRRVTLDINWLAEAARVYKVAWRPMSRFDRAVVERAGKTISTADILSSLRPALQAEGMPKSSHVELSNRNFEINIALDTPATVEVRNVSFEASTGRFNALIVVGGDSGSAHRAMITGRTYAATPLPVLRRAMSPGEIIRKDDIEIIYRREDQVGRDIVTDPAKLIGTSPRSRLRVGEPLRESDTRLPVLVTRSSNVIIKLSHGAMTLTAQGKAEDEGARGDVVRVRNLQSNKVIEATVVGPDTVAVNIGPRAAAFN